MNELCRTCLKKVSSKQYLKLSPEVVYKKKSLLKMLNFSVPEMNIDVGLHPVMCRACANALYHSYKFKKQCLIIEKKFSTCLNCTPQKASETVKNSEKSHTSEETLGNNISEIVNNNNINKNVVSYAKPTKNNAATEQNGTIRKSFMVYRKRFACDNCLGCKNRILNVQFHTEVNDKFICAICNKHYDDLAFLRKHAHEHTKRFECKICGKKWRDNYHLETHLRSHTKEKPFQCLICNKRFAQSYCLQQHMAVHAETTAKNKCDICRKVLSNKYNLKIHMFSHDANKKPKCSMCDKWFYTQAALNKHVLHCTPKIKEEIDIFEPEFIKIEDVSEVAKNEIESDDDPFIETSVNVDRDQKEIYLQYQFNLKEVVKHESV